MNLQITGAVQADAARFAMGKLDKAWTGEAKFRIHLEFKTDADQEIQDQGYRLEAEDSSIRITGADEAGLMYALLDLADGKYDLKELAAGCSRTVNPYIGKRGIKFNIPLDARTPSYSDSGASAQENILTVWDMAFWQNFLDQMAESKYNVLTLWNLSPGPSLVHLDKYPEVALTDVKRAMHPPNGNLQGNNFYTELQQQSLVTIKKMTIDQKIAFWREVMEYACQRCVSVYIFTWNIFVYGTEHTSYGITDDKENPVTRDYFKETVKALVRTYPLLAGIGVTAGENMHKKGKADIRDDVQWIYETYGRGIMEALDGQERDFALIHRSHMASVAELEQVFADFTHDFSLSFKYSMAHMYGAEKPRFGDNFFPQLVNGRKSWLTVRNDDFYYLQWGDPDFARNYLANMPAEQTAGFYMGSDGLIWGKDYSSRLSAERGRPVIDKNWYSMRIWGQLAYDMALENGFFQDLMRSREEADGDKLYEALKLASHAMTLQQRVYWHDFDFQWYPECSCSYLEPQDTLVFRSVIDFMRGRAYPGTGYLSIGEYAEQKLSGEADGNNPFTPAYSARIMREEAEKSIAVLDMIDDRDSEMYLNILAMARLALYYARKISAATALALFEKTLEEKYLSEAKNEITSACANWLQYSALINQRYRPQYLTRMRNAVSPDLFDDCARLDVAIVESYFRQ